MNQTVIIQTDCGWFKTSVFFLSAAASVVAHLSSLKSSICCLLRLLCMFDPNGFLPTCCTDLEVRLPVMNIYDCKRLCRKLRQCSVAIGVRRMEFLQAASIPGWLQEKLAPSSAADKENFPGLWTFLQL